MKPMERTALMRDPAGAPEPPELPPTEDELPCDDGMPDDGMPMEAQRHVPQTHLLVESSTLHWSHRQDFFVGGNMFLYYSLEEGMEALLQRCKKRLGDID